MIFHPEGALRAYPTLPLEMSCFHLGSELSVSH